MQIWKRGYLSVTRRKKQSMKLFLVFFAAGLLLFTGLSVRRGAKEAAGAFRRSLPAGLTLTCRYLNPYDMADIRTNEAGETVLKYKLPLILEQNIKDLLSVEGVSGFYCDTTYIRVCTRLSLLPGANSRMYDILLREDNGQPGYESELETARFGKFITSAVGVYDSRWHPAFVNGAVTLVRGRHTGPGEKGKTLISDVLAERNGLNIGDRIQIQNVEGFQRERYGSLYETEIAGIYHINFEQGIGAYTYESQILANVLFCTSDLAYWHRHEEQVYLDREITAEESESHLESMVLFVEDPDLLDSVKERLLKLDSIGWEYYDIGVYDKDYQTAAAPLLTMIRISSVLIAAAAAGTLLLLLRCFTVWMQERKYETGVLFSIGVKRSVILLQLVLECCSMAVAAFPIAALPTGILAEAAGTGLWNLLFSASNTRKYEVVEDWGAEIIGVHMLPVKGEALSYRITPEMLCFVFFLLSGIAAAAVLISSSKLPLRRPWEVFGKRVF